MCDSWLESMARSHISFNINSWNSCSIHLSPNSKIQYTYSSAHRIHFSTLWSSWLKTLEQWWEERCLSWVTVHILTTRSQQSAKRGHHVRVFVADGHNMMSPSVRDTKFTTNIVLILIILIVASRYTSYLPARHWCLCPFWQSQQFCSFFVTIL